MHLPQLPEATPPSVSADFGCLMGKDTVCQAIPPPNVWRLMCKSLYLHLICHSLQVETVVLEHGTEGLKGPADQ